MTYIIKRKFRGLFGDDVDNSQLASLTQHIQTSTDGLVLSQSLFDTLTVNHLIVIRTNKIPVGTDKYL